jgi:uncharacterized protein (TIGR02145 family)
MKLYKFVIDLLSGRPLLLPEPEVPDVAAAIEAHNASDAAHEDIRALIREAAQAITAGDAATLQSALAAIAAHNTSDTAHTDIRSILSDILAEVETIKGGWSYLPSHDFGTPAPTQQQLSDYAASLGIALKEGLSVVNTYDGHDWRYDAANLQQWADQGLSFVNTASQAIAGIVKGSEENLKIFVNADGTMSVMGLADALAGLAQVNSDWNATEGKAKILNIPAPLTGLAIRTKDSLIFSQEELLSGDKFVCSITGNAALTLNGDLTPGKFYTVVIKNTGALVATVTFPETPEVDLAESFVRTISGGFEIWITVWNDGAFRRWVHRAQIYSKGKMDFVDIGGVKWAISNLAAAPDDPTGLTSVFAARPDDPSSFYQCNRRKAWPATGDITGWDASMPDRGDWLPENAPYPAGWRVPAKEEWGVLETANKTFVAAGLRGNAVAGFFIGDNYQFATMDNMQGCLFLPAFGYYRRGIDGMLDTGNSGAFYHSITPYTYSENRNWYERAKSDGMYWEGGGTSWNYGLFIRCVKL